MEELTLYYNPKTNHLIEFNKLYPFKICGVEIGIVDYYDDIGRMTIGDKVFTYPTGPLFGMTKSMFRDYRKIGKV